MNYTEHQQFLNHLFDGDDAAVALCGAVPTLLNNRHKEKYRDDTLWIALFDIQGNPLFRAHRAFLEPVMKSLLFAWETADEIEEASPDCALAMRQQSAISFVLAVLYTLKGRAAVVDKRAWVAEFTYGELNGSCVDNRGKR
jgi:hypothetical protein